MAKNKGMRERTGQASSSVKKSRRQQRNSSLRPKSKVPPDLKGLESTISVRSSSIKKSILKVQVPVPKEFIIHKIASTSACSRSMEEILSVQVPVPKEIVKHLRKTTSDTEPQLPPVLPSNGTKKDSCGSQNGSTSYNKNSTVGLKREDLYGKELSDPGGKLRGHGEENTNEKLDLKSEIEGTSRWTQSLHGKVFAKNLATEETEASVTKSGGTGIADTRENRKTPGGKMNANFTSGKIVKAENRRLKATRMVEKALLMVKETCSDTKNSVTNKEVLADAGSGQKVDHGILSKQNVTDTLIEKSSVSREVKITQKIGTAPGNGTKCRSTTTAGGKAKNSSASDASKVESIANSSTKREANVAGEREFVKSNNNNPKMPECGDMQVKHTCASDKNNVNDEKDNRNSLFNGQSSTKPQTVAFDKAASSSPNVKFIKEVSKRVHKAMAMATTSTNNGAVSSSKSTNKVSSTSENSDAEKSTNEKKSIEDELKQEDEDGPWVNDEIKKQIDLRNGAYKLFLKKRDEKVLNYYLRLKERIGKMIAHAKQRHLTGKAMTDCVGTVKQKALEFNEVVLIFDKQDEHLCMKLKRLCPRASYIYKENIDYHNAFDSIQGHRSFGKKTLYVLACGALTALYSQVDPICLNKGCTPVYRRYRLVSEDADSIYNHLVEHALLLRKNVEANNTDRVIFLEMIIADLDVLESLEIKCHFKNCGHKPERYFRHTPWKSTLAAAFFRFNFWLLEDKEELGFSCWCLEGLLLNYLKIGVMNIKINTRGKIKWHPLRRRRLRMVCLAVQETLIDSEDSSVSSRHVPTKIAPPDCEMEVRSDILIVYEKMVTGNVVSEKRATEPSRSESQNTSKERQKMEPPALQTVDKGLAGELHIVVIFDDQDSCLQGVKFPFVTSIFSKNLDFFSGCASVESLPSKQNALIIVLSGIKTVVKLSMDPECMRVGCSQKLYRISPTLTDSDSILKELVSGALLFRKRVTEGKSRYRVVFSGLLPPSLYHIDKYAVDNHYRQCNHKAPLHSKEYFAAMNLVLGDAVRKYNTWAKDDASVQGFLGWDIESIFTTESSKIFHHELEHDGVSLTPVCQEKRKNALKGAIEYTHTILVPAVQESSRSSDELKFIPTAITLVFDETQDFLANIKMPLVSYLNTSNSHIRFQDVHAEIKSLKYARERTLYVIFGGIETVFRLTEDSDCRFFSCHSPLKRIELLSETDDGLAKMLVSHAQSLKREIERINKCKVIFRTLLPIDLKTVDEYAIREHLRRCKHQARYHPKGWLEKQNRTLALAVDHFNVWARSDARQLGLCDWNVDDIFAGLTIGSDFMFLPDTRIDGRSLTKKWESLMTEVITASLEKTFDAINQIKENKKVETSGSRPCTLMPNMLSSFSKAENHQFDHVAIVVNTLYSHILQDFQSPRVTVIEAEQLTVCQIPRLVKQHHCGKDKKILWLLPVGIYSLTEFYQHPSCQHCANPLHVITLGHDGLPSEEYMMNHNKDMLQKARALYQVLQQELGPDAFVLFVPPIRAMVVVKEMFQSHPLLHRVCEKNNAFCADAEMLSVLREHYNRFCELWKSLVPGKFSALSSLSIITKYQIENQGQNVVPIVDDEDYTFAVEIWKDMLKDFIRESLDAVQIDQNSISIHPDKGKHILHKPPNRKCVSTVQSGQNIRNNILPKPPNTHSISAVCSGQTIGKHILPKTPNRQSITAVQSGQTTGENSSPKPPNKHSITAVQSGQTTGENSSPKPPNKHSITAVQSGQTTGENSSPKPPNKHSITAVQSGQTIGKNSSPKPPNKHSITAVQSGQTTGENSSPKPLNKHSITAVQSGQTTGENSSPKPPNKHSITAVQSGQTTGENSSPKPPNKHSITAVQSGQTTGENSSPKPPNKHSITAVQSGQTIGENSSPKPPNKHSITAVQSGQTIGENSSPKPPNKHSITAVQSGQTTGENSSPKPPNKHSITAVQSGQTIGKNTLPKPPNKQFISAVQSGQTIGKNTLPKPPNKHSIGAVQSGQTIGKNTLPKPPNKPSITAVQSGQTTGENSSPKPPNKHSITAVQSGQTTGENSSPKPPNKHSITAVQSGQTTGENSSPKPPNKHSITAVQSGQTTGENSSPKPPNKQFISAVQSGQTIGKNTLHKPPNKQFISAVQSGQKTALVSNTGKKDMFKSFDTMSLTGVQNAQITSSAMSNAGKEGLNCERMSHTNVSKIEHIIVVGSKNVCACIESIQNQFPVTFIHENVDFSEECIKRFAAYQENVPFRTAWIILTDILLLTKQSSSDTPCSNARCQNPFEYDILKTDVNFPFMAQKVIIERMVDKVLANIISFAMNLIKELTPGSFVYFTPIAPLRGMIIPPTTEHDRIHALKKLGPDVRLLKGTYLCWIRCARNFSKMWKKFMLENTSTSVVHDLLVKYYFNKSVCCLVPVHDEKTIKGNSIQETRWRYVVKEMIQKIALSKGEYPNSSLGPFALRFNPRKSEAASEKGVSSARQPQAKATDKAKVEKTAGPVLHPASDVPVTSLSEKANRATKAPQDLFLLSTDGPPSAASTTSAGSPGNVSTSMNSSLLKKTAAVNSLNQSKSGGIVSTLPYTIVSETSPECSSCTTAKVAVSSTIPHKAQGSVSPITAKSKSTEPSVIQPKTSNKTLNRDVKNTVESAHGTSGIRDSREVSGKTSVTEKPSLEENCKNVLKSSNTVKEPHLLGNEKEHSVSLSSLKTCENVSGRKDVCKTNAVQSSKPNKNIIVKNMLSATMKTLSGKSLGRGSNAVDIKNEATSCFASPENVSGKTETCCETFYEKLMPNKLTSEKLCNASKMSLSKVSLESPEVTSNLSPRKLPLELSENVTVSSDNCGTYVVSPNTLGNTGEGSVATESVSLVKGSSKITSIPEATDKDKDMNLSSSNQKVPFGTVASLSGDTSQAKSCAEAVQADSSYTEFYQRPSTVVSTNPNEGQDLPASIPKDKISSKRKPRAVLDSVSSESELASKASVVKSEPVSRETNKMSSVSTTIPQASIVGTSVKVSNSKAIAEPQASSANIIPLAKESCSGTSSPKKGGTLNVTSKPAPSSVALVIQSRSGSPSSVNTMAKIPAPTCIVHPTKVHDKVLSSHKGIVAEIHSSLKSSSVTTTVPSGSGKYTLAVKDHGSVPLKMVSLNEGIPTAVVTPKINLQKNCTVAKPSSSKVEDTLIVKDPSNQTTYGIILMNIHRSIKDEDLKVLFEACGQVHSMQRPSNILGKPAEYCVVKFLSHDVALRAKQLFSAVILAGKPLEVKNLENYAENSSENVLQADRLIYHKLEKIAMKCKVNLSLKDEMLIQYTTQERLENDGLPNPSKGGRSDNKEDDEISLSSVSLSSLEDSDDDKFVSKGTGRKVYGKEKADTNVKDCQKVKAAATASLKETYSSSTSRAGGQGLYTSSKVTSKSQKKNSLSSKGTMNGETFVKVSNLSDVVPWEIVDRLLQACGALDKGKFEETSGAKVYQFPTYKSALLAEGQLKGLRLLDKILNVKMMCNTSGEEPVLKLDEEMKIRNHALLVLGDYENIMVSVAKTIAESGVNVYSYKTKLCTKESCASHQLCHDYHSAEDRRRNPLLYNYSSTMCNTVRNSKECKRHDECEDAHSTVEILFHKTKFRSHVCVGWSTLRACPMIDKVCPFAHPDCPDLFFHPVWEDLYVEGLHNTLLFLSGAILNHFRLQLSGSRNEVGHSTQRSVPCVHIMVITPSADMVKLYVQAVKELALTCNMEVAAVTLGTATRDSSVLIGTPASLSKLLAEEKSKTSRKQRSGKALGTISNIRAIILDDASSVLKEFSSVSHQALERLLGTPGINKVAISEVIRVSEVHKTSRLFNCKMKELPVREQPQSDNIKITKEVFESAAQSIPKRTFSPVQDQACRNTSSPPPQSQLFDKSKSGNITHTTVALAQSHGLMGESSPLSPVSDTETVLYSAGGRSPLLSASPPSSPPDSPRKGFTYENPLNVPQEPSSAKRQRTSYSSGGEVSSQCRKKLRSSYYSRDYSPSSSSSSRDYPSYYAFPKYNENFLEESSSQRHDNKPYDKRYKSFHHNSEDEFSPLSEYSTRRHSRSNSHKRKSRLPEQLPRRWKTSSRHSSNSSDRDTQRHKSRSPKRSSRGREMSSRRKKRSSDRSEKYNSESSEVSPKRKHHRGSEYENRRRHLSSSKDSKKRHKCKKHLSKHFCSSSVRQRETSLSSILLKEELSKDVDGKRKSGREDAATRSSHQVKNPSDTGVQSPPPLKKQSKSEEAGESNLSEAKEDLSAAVHFLKPEKGPVLLDKVPSWSEVTKHQSQQNSVLLKSKDILARELCKNPEKDVAISGMPSPSEKDIATSRMPSLCENCRIKFDPETDEEFLQLEKSMKEMHTADYQVFLDSPEVHPDYDSSYLMFEQCYQQRYGNKSSNENRQSVWTMFWAELVHDQEKEEWMVKREGLLKQFENDRKNCKCASEIKESLGKENECSSDSSDVIFISESTSSNSQSPPSASGAFCLANPSSSVANDSEGVRKPQTSASRNMEDNGALLLNLTSEKDLDPLLSESLIILDEVCDSLGEFFGSLLKKVIGRVKEFSDTREAFLYLGKEDTIKLLEMTEEKIRGASITAEGSRKNKLFYGGQLIKRLISYASKASTCSEFDISQLAKAAMNQDTSFVLNMIRERMKTHGIKNPPVDAVRQVYSEVSSWRLKTVLSDM